MEHRRHDLPREASPKFQPPLAAVDTGGLSRAAFPKGFVFGTATSAFQVEGMADGGGRGPSIWDPFVHTPGNIAEKHHASLLRGRRHGSRWPLQFTIRSLDLRSSQAPSRGVCPRLSWASMGSLFCPAMGVHGESTGSSRRRPW